jgi:Methyltransferase domain
VTAEAEGRRAALTRLKELAKRSAAIGRVHAWGRETRVGRRTAERVWKDGLPEELAFWEKRLRDPDVATNWHAYAHRTDPDAPVGDPVVTALLDQIPEADVSILDVGAGPLTALGKTHPGKNVRITATDPLADHYNRILREAGIDPPVQTVACRGEELRERFAAGTFDIAFSQNALDHSIDPAKVIEDMVELVGEGLLRSPSAPPARGSRSELLGTAPVELRPRRRRLRPLEGAAREGEHDAAARPCCATRSRDP